MARRRVNVFGLAFLDAMTCGLGAVVLLYMVINASVGVRSGERTHDYEGEVDRLEVEVLEGHKNLVELKNALRVVEEKQVTAQGLSKRLIESIQEIKVELATYDQATIAQREHLNRLQADLRSLEEEAKRLSASIPSDETPGRRVRAYVGDGDRQYLTGLKIGGRRIFLLVDASASMLGETIVNVILRRNLPDSAKVHAEKWQQAVSTVDWLTTQLPRDSHFQAYTFNESARPLVPGSGNEWLPGGDRKTLDRTVQALRQVVPGGGTNLQRGLAAAAAMRPPPDNLILLVDGLPTQGARPPQRRTVSGKERLKLFNDAVDVLPRGLPVNVILFPMEGDPMAASSFWKLAIATRGSFMSPAKDWP